MICGLKAVERIERHSHVFRTLTYYEDTLDPLKYRRVTGDSQSLGYLWRTFWPNLSTHSVNEEERLCIYQTA